MSSRNEHITKRKSRENGALRLTGVNHREKKLIAFAHSFSVDVLLHDTDSVFSHALYVASVHQKVRPYFFLISMGRGVKDTKNAMRETWQEFGVDPKRKGRVLSGVGRVNGEISRAFHGLVIPEKEYRSLTPQQQDALKSCNAENAAKFRDFTQSTANRRYNLTLNKNEKNLNAARSNVSN